MSGLALVTGGTRGIGAAISKSLKAEGYAVAAIYHGNDQAAERFMQETGISVFKWDVADEAECLEGVRRVEAELGTVNLLVNNAGITRDGMFHRMSWEQWRAVLGTNLDSMFTMTRAIIEGMRERRYGRIVNISSINGQKGQVGQVNYSAAKAGVIGFTKALAQENASRGITVNAVCPGYVDTEMVASVKQEVRDGIIAGIPVGRLGAPDEIAEAVCYLASRKAGFCTGAVLSINGGQYIANG
ncbi:MAG TPA: beta-ketoacyl-ACP reductase [Sphingobium sp.]|jgi:acetoacetyl-CoA reductase|uniref:Acetoacetyl-CoA reductase n=1 Tax=Sphingobium yanoikuyae TaxID=13690 RepID=A0A6M4GG53_SPHYA|nr:MULTISPECIES: acetoacetyl-CoA reductase [Sphingobium]OAN58721.1 beta-ketoacyl-ACP reductase [Sphingobium sp. TCM1]QJR05344.1 acetoacetyl-CoA reductase [Sphingobium yanoikuyae]HAF43294.1 beta-ketoacyl-ACP reductase [Sphingobium sp.]